MSKEHVLLIEDDADIREGVRILLESEAYIIEEAGDGRSGLALLHPDTDLVILDIMMPGMSGLRTCEEIRKISNVPVLFLTAKAQESDKLLGRVKALLRRYRVYCGKKVSSEESEAETTIRLGEICVNETFNEVSASDRPIDLSDIEYHIMSIVCIIWQQSLQFCSLFLCFFF